jgi:hypothetical protein
LYRAAEKLVNGPEDLVFFLSSLPEALVWSTALPLFLGQDVLSLTLKGQIVFQRSKAINFKGL